MYGFSVSLGARTLYETTRPNLLPVRDRLIAGVLPPHGQYEGKTAPKGCFLEAVSPDPRQAVFAEQWAAFLKSPVIATSGLWFSACCLFFLVAVNKRELE